MAARSIDPHLAQNLLSSAAPASTGRAAEALLADQGSTITQDLTIALVGENPARAAIIAAGLREAGQDRIVPIAAMANLVARLHEISPDVVMIDLASPAPDMLEQLFQVVRLIRRPVAIFVDRSGSGMIDKAVEAGVAAYIVDGLKKERIEPVLALCLARFRARARLEAELADARAALEARKLVDRAKGLLMKHKGISEDEAYGLLRRRAMNEKRRIAEVAAAVVTGLDMLG